MLGSFRAKAGFFFLQMGGIHHHEARQLRGRRRRYDLALKAAFDEKRQPSAMIEMGVGQKHDVDAGRIETEGMPVLLFQFAAALKQSAIDQNALACTFEKMTRTGDGAVGTVKCKFQGNLSPLTNDTAHSLRRAAYTARQLERAAYAAASGVPLLSYQCKMPSQISWAVSVNQNNSRSSCAMTPSSIRKSISTARRQ